MRQLLHTISGAVIVAMNAAAVLRVRGEAGPDQERLGENHDRLGRITTFAAMVLFFAGIFDRLLMLCCKRHLRIMILFKDLHRWLGMVVVFVAQVTIMAGLYNYGAKVKELIFLHMAILVVIYSVCEILYRKYGRVKSLQGIIATPRANNTISKVEF